MPKNRKAGSGRSAPARSRYQIKAQGDAGAELLIYGDIGEDWWAEESNDAKTIVDKLSEFADVSELTVRINSYGGSVADGIAIYNAIKRHPADVSIHVEGVAVSIASLIAMAGDTVLMPANTLMMIHAPWGMAVGNAPELRDMADTLDKYAQAMASSYAAKTGHDYDEMLALLTDGEDHWYTAAEAVEAGFADAMVPGLAAAASLRMDRYQLPAAPAAQSKEGNTMTKSVTPAPADQIPEPQGSIQNVSDIEKAAQARERERIQARNAEIKAMFAKHLAKPGVSDLYHEILADTAVEPLAAGQRLLDHLGADAEPINPAGSNPRISITEDERDKRFGAVSAALMVRAGVATPEIRAKADRQNPYRGMRLLDLARDSLTRAGVRYDGMLPMEMVAAAFTQSTSDFPVLLENTMHKTLLAAYAIQPDTWSRFCATGSVSDFRAHNRYRTGSFGDLDVVNEAGEFTNKPIPDGEKATISAQTKGNVINLSRQMVVNDDLGAFIGIARDLGRAARRSIENDVYAILTANSGLGPTQTDGQPLFHSNRANIGTAGVNSPTSWGNAASVMASQMDISGNDFLDLRPAVWVGPIAVEAAAKETNMAEYNDEATKNQRRPNTSRGLVRDIVGTPRLAGTRWYMFADPAVSPVIEVAFLDGVQEPFLEQQIGFDVDGTRYKVRLDYGVAVVDYRGAVTNAGTA